MSIIANPVTPAVLGQPISPNFGVQFAGAPGANPIVNPTPLADTIGGPKLTLLEAVTRGSMPRNAGLATVGGVSMGAGDVCSVDEAMSNGNGAQTCEGVAVPNNPGVPQNAATLNNGSPQIFADGVSQAAAVQVTGPTPFNTESLTSAPTSTAALASQVVIAPANYQG